MNVLGLKVSQSPSPIHGWQQGALTVPLLHRHSCPLQAQCGIFTTAAHDTGVEKLCSDLKIDPSSRKVILCDAAPRISAAGLK